MYWSQRQTGIWIPVMKIRKASLKNVLKVFNDGFRRHRHKSREEQYATLTREALWARRLFWSERQLSKPSFTSCFWRLNLTSSWAYVTAGPCTQHESQTRHFARQHGHHIEMTHDAIVSHQSMNLLDRFAN